MKILFLVPQINECGGVARVLSLKTTYLIERWNYDVHIVTQNKGNENVFFNFHSKVVTHDITLNKNNWFVFLKDYITQLNQIVTIIKPDIIFVLDNGLKSFLVPLILQTTKKIVFECHSSLQVEEKRTNPILKKLLVFYKKKMIRNFDLAVFLSKESQVEWGVNKRAVVIPNPIIPKVFKASSLNKKRVISVIRNSYEKGLDRLLSVWNVVGKQNPDWVLEVYGFEKGYFSEETLQNKFDLISVQFYPPIKNIGSKYAESSVFVLTSRFEAFGMVLLEAMASGLPIVAYDVPIGPKSIIESNKTGFLIKDGDEKSFCEQLNALMNDIKKRQQMALKGIEKSGEYEINKTMESWNFVIKQLLKK